MAKTKKGSKLRSPISGAAGGYVTGKRVSEPWRKTASMTDILKYEPIGADINPKRTAIMKDKI